MHGRLVSIEMSMANAIFTTKRLEESAAIPSSSRNQQEESAISKLPLLAV